MWGRPTWAGVRQELEWAMKLDPRTLWDELMIEYYYWWFPGDRPGEGKGGGTPMAVAAGV